MSATRTPILRRVLLAALTAVLAACNGDPAPSEPLGEAADDTAMEHAAKHQDPDYVCPMHPRIVQDEPGSCPICGMDLVEQEPRTGGGSPVVELDSATVRHMNLQTTEVTRQTLWKYIETVGRIAYDESRVYHVHPRTSGWVEELHIEAVGDPVEAGQTLLTVYSPEIVGAQEELLIEEGRRERAGGRLDLRRSARIRLEWLDVPAAVIDAVAESGEVRRDVPVIAPADGVVTELGLREGMYVTPELEMYTIADLSSVWALVEIPEPQQAWVSEGAPAEIRVDGLPGRVFEGQVDYVYPELDPRTRTLTARLRFANPGGRLKPGMLADAVVYGGPARDRLAIPASAVIPSADGPRVVRVTGENRYRPVAIETGMRAGDRVAVLSGLEAGDRVVTNGQFMLDSESNLRASLGRMSGGHDH